MIFYFFNSSDILLILSIILYFKQLLLTMGIDLIRGGRIPSRGLRKTKTTNQYLKSLIKVLKYVYVALLLPK